MSHDRIPGIPGGVPILGQRQQEPPPRTFKHVHFQGCQITLDYTLNPDGTIHHTEVRISDPWELTQYHYTMGPEGFDKMDEFISESRKKIEEQAQALREAAENARTNGDQNEGE